ncbi:unnamed protein product (macronuclear) [Paramecium tetraurelia]|uniref:UVR domain-containing protein n=1 Tax=Paramecium tetraurelia TaxID=5888 RepID=A0DHA7_PARTE|nr:uncharacterized protein GSPATT00016811001 [Paramecium tetraurelia]CAK82424.1 unnamed protein product [Paramecium tetraurelia]|eukprot:XP_001449821.1 hypothetical protein (macronuclear) [Paramecium tetraurelia strain d4-2]
MSSNSQQNQLVPSLITPKESMFKGSLKVKTTLQTPPQQQSNPQYITQDTQKKASSPPVSIIDSAHNQQSQIMEFPLDQHNVDQNVEIKIDVAQVKKATSGFSFLQKAKQETSQSTDESTQDQNESFIVCGMNSQQNSTQIYPQDQIVFSFQNNEMTNQQASEGYQQSQVNTNHSTLEQKDVQQITDAQNYKNLIQNMHTQIDGSHLEQYSTLIKQLHCFQQEKDQRKCEIFLQQQKIESLISLNHQQLNNFQNQLNQIFVEQQTFASPEQVEISLQEQYVQIQNTIQKIEEEIKIYEFEFNNFQNEKLKIKSEELKYYNITDQKLDEIENFHLKYIDQYQQEGSSQIKRLLQILDEENERLKIQQIHIDIDYKHLDEEEQHLNQIMDNQTKDYRVSQDLLLQKKLSLNSEITQLQLMLSQKILDLQLTDQELIQTKDKIQQVQQKFNQQLGKVQNKRTKLLDELKGLSVEKLSIENLENECIKRQLDYKNKLQDLQDSLNIIKEKRSNLLENTNLIPVQCQEEIKIFHKYQVQKQVSFSLLQELQQVQRQIDGLKYQRNISQQQLHEILNQKSELQIKLPKMIDCKAQFVQNKNFKGAAQINEQIKEVQKQIILFENNISQNQQKESQLLQQIDDIEDTLLLKQQQFKQLNQVTEILRYQFQELKLKQIQQLGFQGLSSLIQEISSELKLLQQKNEDMLNSNKKFSQDIPIDITGEEQLGQNNQRIDKDSIHKQQLLNQENDYPEIQQQIQQLKEKVIKYAKEDQFQLAHQIQQQLNEFQNEALRLDCGVKRKLEIDSQERLIY